MNNVKHPVPQIFIGPGRPPTRRRQSLHDQIVEDLRIRLLEGRIAPGQKIPEKALCEELEISRTPLREAMKVLAAEELINLLPHRGAIATVVTPQQAKDLFQVLASLEHLIGVLVAKQLTSESFSEIEALHHKMLDFHERRRRTDYFRLNVQIHLKLAEMTDNETLQKTYFSLTQKAMRARYLANMSDGRWSESAGEHELILDALRLRDSKALSKILVRHAELTGAAVVTALKALQKTA